MSSAPAGRKPGRGGRGRGRGGRGSRGRGRGTNKKSEKNSSTVNNESNSGGYAKDSSEIQTPMAALRDEVCVCTYTNAFTHCAVLHPLKLMNLTRLFLTL